MSVGWTQRQFCVPLQGMPRQVAQSQLRCVPVSSLEPRTQELPWEASFEFRRPVRTKTNRVRGSCPTTVTARFIDPICSGRHCKGVWTVGAHVRWAWRQGRVLSSELCLAHSTALQIHIWVGLRKHSSWRVMLERNVTTCNRILMASAKIFLDFFFLRRLWLAKNCMLSFQIIGVYFF